MMQTKLNRDVPRDCEKHMKRKLPVDSNQLVIQDGTNSKNVYKDILLIWIFYLLFYQSCLFPERMPFTKLYQWNTLSEVKRG